MHLFPAIDVRAGRVVRMRRGDASHAIEYAHDPLGLAERYARAGARWLHVVDLDRVFGLGRQDALVAELARRAGAAVSVQAGGGLTTADEAAAVLACGAARVLVRAAAGLGPGGFAVLARRCGAARLALALDARGGMVDFGDGAGAGTLTAAEVARDAAAAGIRTIVFTDLAREGRLGGADVAGAAALAREAGVDVIVSGGVSALDEVTRIREAGLAGAVVGRALLEERFTLAEALACSSSP